MDTVRSPQEQFASLYADLKRLAHARLRAAGDRHELNTTALVHESFLKLAERGALLPQNRNAFFSYVGNVMRSVVLDCVRERQAGTRGGTHFVVRLTTDVPGESFDDARLLAIDEALDSLAQMAPDLLRLVEMRYFVGLSIPEISEITGQPVRTLEHEWGKARGMLHHLMTEAL
jgi:RNA polymerase sigma factor (TIGR02999 family)